MTREEIALSFRISRKTLVKRLARLGFILPKGIVMPKDVAKIYELLGPPVNPKFTKKVR